MKTVRVSASEEGRRLDRVLAGYLPKAAPAFFHKMLRKKNIVVNGKKQDAAYRVKAGDEITFWLSEETFGKFSVQEEETAAALARYREAYEGLAGDEGARPEILYEDEQLLLLNKPAGLLSQRAKGETLSVNEWLCGYLLAVHATTEEELRRFRPSVANRLDAGTSGLMVCVKTLPAARDFALLQREGLLEKRYLAVVCGCVREGFAARDALVKDHIHNKAIVTKNVFAAEEKERMRAEVLCVNEKEELSLLSLTLLDGKSHQLRAQLSHRGFPVLGDGKYGNAERNREMRQRFGLRTQLLHSESLGFPEDVPEALRALAGKCFAAPLPAHFLVVRDEYFENI
ncbi:MAG: RluA family pseudouridine synthase [Lachnospiraceae bacterium]|nr:RluA family pseudouridine synthase [Lachnospiraceae bacterium]